ncbi:MAG: ribosome small subunit-dependent GTPase A, partial [Defluviitaleaceae bacterium]|nr:ribosome small subunit-dependent GTPase A [Defluviitaleaceae bacterium]
DVSEDELMLDIEAALPGVDILAVSAAAGKNMDALRGRMEPGKTYVFLGMSGVGKSTLINALAGEEVMAVSDTGAGNMARGRHTTTHRQMFLLPNGALVIDTPGMRTMSVEGAAAGVTAVFGDVEALGAACRFSDCTHRSEPGCAVREAIRRGTLDKARLADYRKLKRIEGFEDKKERISAARLKNFMTRQTSKKKYE